MPHPTHIAREFRDAIIMAIRSASSQLEAVVDRSDLEAADVTDIGTTIGAALQMASFGCGIIADHIKDRVPVTFDPKIDQHVRDCLGDWILPEFETAADMMRCLERQETEYLEAWRPGALTGTVN